MPASRLFFRTEGVRVDASVSRIFHRFPNRIFRSSAHVESASEIGSDLRRT
ncbi:hypothetical protein BURMUCGD1_0695 [Burkholderia multivorans CGD1]|nr:hypothetical protein BURMUCGD1_0695 [Burkholderia multivorans CGD1]